MSPIISCSSLRLVARVGALTCLAAIAASTVRGELLFERHQGGPEEYRTAGVNHAGIFQVTEAVRVQAVSGWFTAGSGYYGYDFENGSGEFGFVRTSITEGPLGGPGEGEPGGEPLDFSSIFRLTALPPAPEGQRTPAGRWAIFGGLHWDLQPGSYSLNFFGADMPLSYGYHGPVHNVPAFDGFFYNFAPNDPLSTDFPFGMRIYGRELSAVPEPAAYGLVASLLLGLTVMGWRARRLRDEVD